MRRRRLVPALLALGLLVPVLGLGACGGAASGEIRSPAGRLPADAPAADVQALARDQARFALAVGAHLGEPDNVAWSPYSVDMALRMVRLGASGDSAAALDRLMGPGAGDPRRAAAIATLDQRITAAARGDGVVFGTANQAWLHQDLVPREPFLDGLARAFGAGVRTADFRTDPARAVEAVNDWVDDRTDGHIDRLLERLGPDTRFVLVNAIHMQADWEHTFDAESTSAATFTTVDGRRVKVPTMHMHRDDIEYAEAPDGSRLVRLPYTGGSIAMVAVLPPDRADVREWERGLTADWMAAARSRLTAREVSLALPTFSADPGSVSLVPALTAAGLRPVFGDTAGLQALAEPVPGEPLVLSDVVHRARVDVDEEGTTASAASAATGLAGAAAPGDALQRMDFDRPFAWWIEDTASGALLFMGRVGDPGR